MLWAEDRATDGGTLLARADFTYDVNGNLIQKTVGSLTTRYGLDGTTVWADLDNTNAVQVRYVSPDSADALGAKETAAGVVTWYLTDHLGSVRALMSTAGVAIDKLTYDAFGAATETMPSQGDRFKYAGYQLDATTNLYDVQARWYDPTTGRWTSEDPIRTKAGDSDLYRYVGNNATDATDPSGLFNPKDTWEELDGATQFRWTTLAESGGWTLVTKAKNDGHVEGLSSNFNTSDSNRVNVYDGAFKAREHVLGWNQEWVSNRWAIDYTNKRIFIDATWDWRAAESVKTVVDKIWDKPTTRGSTIGREAMMFQDEIDKWHKKKEAYYTRLAWQEFERRRIMRRAQASKDPANITLDELIQQDVILTAGSGVRGSGAANAQEGLSLGIQLGRQLAWQVAKDAAAAAVPGVATVQALWDVKLALEQGDIQDAITLTRVLQARSKLRSTVSNAKRNADALRQAAVDNPAHNAARFDEYKRSLAAQDSSAGKVRWVDEPPKLDKAARNYEDAATGARSSVETRRRQVPALDRTLADGSKTIVKFDGVEGEFLIDRKTAVTTFPKSKDQALRQSQALRENGFGGRWEVPNATEATRAQKMIDELKIGNIEVKVVPLP